MTGDDVDLSSIPKEARPWLPIVTAVTRNSPIDPALVLALMQAESGFDPRARSRAGASGLMQLIPSGARTALIYLTGYRCSIPDAALFRPSVNILLGVAYLEWLWIRKFGASLPHRFGTSLPYLSKTLLCVAAYNAGPNRLSRWLTKLPTAKVAVLTDSDVSLELLIDTLNSTIPLGETRHFVRSVAGHWKFYSNSLGLVSPSQSAEPQPLPS